MEERFSALLPLVLPSKSKIYQKGHRLETLRLTRCALARILKPIRDRAKATRSRGGATSAGANSWEKSGPYINARRSAERERRGPIQFNRNNLGRETQNQTSRGAELLDFLGD